MIMVKNIKALKERHIKITLYIYVALSGLFDVGFVIYS